MTNNPSSLREHRSHAEGGAIAVIFALTLIPIMLAIGAAIDLSRAYVARTRIAYALDAAGLAVGSSVGTEAELEEVLNNFFKANYPDGAIGDPIDLSLEMDESVIKVSATRRVATTFMQITGIENMDVYVEAEITRETKGLEVALVLDNTGSMGYNSKMSTMKDAASDLVEILFGSEDEADNLKVALVPYVTSVNIGRDNKDWVDFTRVTTPDIPPYFTGDDLVDQSNLGTVWKGCVVERDYPMNVQDTPFGSDADPDAVAETYWRAYGWPQEPRYHDASGHNSSYCHNKVNSAGTRWNYIDETPSSTSGPNMSCPNPIMPLHNVKEDLLDEIDTYSHWSYGGTMAHIGLAWGMRVLSPEPPFTEGLPWGEEGWNKAIIILTDGVNELVKQDWRCDSPSTSRPNTDYWSQPKGGPYTDFSGEGYPIDDERIDLDGHNNAAKYESMKSRLNQYTAEVCENIKAKDILLYTITFQLNNATTQELFRQCATDENKYFNSPSNEELTTVFRAIGAELSNLRLSK